MTRTQRLVLVAAVASLTVTAAITAIPNLSFAHRGLELHVAVQTADALIGLLAGYLVLGRFRRSQRSDDLVLAAAFVTLAFTNLAFGAIPMVAGEHTNVFATWSAATGRLLGAALLAAAAFAPSTRLRTGRRADVGTILGIAVALAVIAAVAALLEPVLPRTVDVTPEGSSDPDLSAHPAVLSAQLAGMVLYAIAAVGFTRRAERRGDDLLRWLAVAAVFGAAARLNYFLYPSLFTEWVYTGDFFRLLFYLVVLVAAMREISSYWSNYAEAATYDERRRIARELHDGLAQELASIRRNLSWVDEDNQFVRRAFESADRALIESRRAIAALSARSHDRIDVALGELAREVGQREGIKVALNVDAEIELALEDRNALLMIASEALTNAARHSGADTARVELSAGRRLRLRIVDTGSGFEVGDDFAGFGLRGMRERAETIGARLHVESRPDRGTEVEVVL